jgi:hypothetical protein
MSHEARRRAAADVSRRIRETLTGVLLSAAAVAPATGQAAPDTVVKQAGAPRHAGIAALVPELSIGTLDGAPAYAFGQVEAILPTRDGGVLVLDAPNGAAPELRQYDAAGTYVRTVGRRGEGPGEYRGPSGLAQLGDGRILLLDGPNRRINVYSEAGEPIDTWMLGDVIVSTGGGEGLRVGQDGTVYARVSVRREGGRLFDSSSTVYLRLAADGAVIDQLPLPQLPDVGGTITRTTANSGTRIGVPYAPQAVWAFSPLGGFVTGVTNRYAFELRMPRAARSGPPVPWSPADGVISVRRTVEPVPVPRAERAARRRDLEARIAGPGTLSGPIPDIAAIKPPYRAIETGADGSVWIAVATPSERYHPPEADVAPAASIGAAGVGRTGGAPPVRRVPAVPWRQPTRYDVFEPDGTYVGQVAVPYDTRIVHRRGDVVWGITTDENDVPTVQRFRIAWR